ncbi:MAG: DUF4180 domain-containing protein [Spirochaetaceae bacterium]|jgi:hypothetical protein|nr:DUF4180 domain-containing protein [Spirochaetaceae bacterium]
MKTTIHEYNGIQVTEFLSLPGGGVLIEEDDDFLDVMMICPGKRAILRREQISEDFFDLRTGLAGRILQKASIYRFYLGIVGDFDRIESSSLRDFIYESNRTGLVAFKKTVPEVLELWNR